VIKWDGDFETTEESLKYMIEKYNLRERTDQFALWFSGITKFYGKYMNVSSYYDEYRCFSKLNGFMWVDTNHCESAGNYVKDGNTKRYVIGYDNDDNPVWLSDIAKRFDYVRKPVFIENKNYKDFKEYTLDERCRNDNMILTKFRDMPGTDKKKEIIFIVILERTNIGGVETVSKTLENYLLYFGKDVRYILLKPTGAVDNKKYYSLDSFMDMLDLFRDDKLFIYTSYQVETDQINKNGNVKFIGISHSDISYYNKYFTENSGLYNKIIVVNNSCYQKYKKLNVDNVVLMRNNIEILTVESKREFDSSCIKVLFFSRTSYDKNVIMLMDVIDRLWSEGVKIYLDIYSDLDKTTSYYYNMVKHKECIAIKAPTNNKNIYLEYDLCVLPSVSEGCSMNVLESINHEVPILCSKNIGNEEIIENYFPMFDLIGLDSCKDDLYVTNYNKLLISIGYKLDKNDLGLELMKSGREVYDKNVNEMKRKIQMVIDNYSFYKNQTITLKNNIKVILNYVL
jgi:glycosyltransferase involved in cell wall biosynthesis